MAQAATQHEPTLELDFDEALVPWVDRRDADIDAYVAAQASLPVEYDLREKLNQWRRDGYAIFPNAADHSLIDKYVADLEQAKRDHKRYHMIVNTDKYGHVPISHLQPEDFVSGRMRFNDFHNSSIAGKKLMLSPVVTSFLRHLFQDDVVATQSLTFERGSEQPAHQDNAYVWRGSKNPSHLAASWIALEDIHPDAGPLGYYPGSHRIRKFNFGDGLFMTDTSPHRDRPFTAHILAECQRLGLPLTVFTARKGDVFLWHAALAHCGTTVKNRALTRRSLVSHYTSRSSYPRDQRDPEEEPKVFWHNGACLYENAENPADEDAFA